MLVGERIETEADLRHLRGAFPAVESEQERRRLRAIVATRNVKPIDPARTTMLQRALVRAGFGWLWIGSLRLGLNR
jgi:hypothetical protein